MSLIAELKRRNVFRVAAAYAVVGWLLVEVASVVLPTFDAPNWVMKVFTFLVIVGFPLALVFAWAFELTPEGIKREAEVDPAESITHVTGRKLDFAIIGLLMIAVVYLVIDKYILGTISDPPPGVREKSIAVLPFDNISPDPEDAYFADGIHDEVLAQLSKIRDLKVISRTSVMHYRGDAKPPLPEIAAALSVANILEGSVRLAENRVRITTQLIEAETDVHLWTETYDRELTAASIFSIQSDVAKAVADALQAALSPQEEQRLNTVPTENMAALKAYFLGTQRLAKLTSVAIAEAVAYFEQAIELDPGFALAYVGLADSYVWQSIRGDLALEEMLEKAQAAADRALALDDQLGEAHSALCGIRVERDDWEGAEAACQRALQLSPNLVTALNSYGELLLIGGRAGEALTRHRRAAELDPLSAYSFNRVGAALSHMGRSEEALLWFEKTLKLDPGYGPVYHLIGSHYHFASGQLDEAFGWYAIGASLDPGDPVTPAALGWLFLDLGDPGKAEYWISRSIELNPKGRWPNVSLSFLYLYRNDETALDDGRKLLKKFPSFGWGARLLLRDHELKAGRYAEARALYEKRFPELLTDDPRIDVAAWPAIDLALVLSRTGKREQADLLLNRSFQYIQATSRLGFYGYGVADVKIYALRGDKQKALSALRQAIDEGWRTLWWYHLKYDPTLESLHDEPEYQAMVAEIEADMAAQLAHVREMERNGELEPIPEVSATAQ